MATLTVDWRADKVVASKNEHSNIQWCENRRRYTIYCDVHRNCNSCGGRTCMRMSRSNEVDREFGSIKESLWIGHSERVKKDHYYRIEHQ